MPTEFVHLHTHSDYSMLDGACKISSLAELAQKFNMTAAALTDHGNLCGAIEFYTQMSSSGIKPIIGCECYLAPESRFEKNQKHPHHKGYHQILYAKDYEGYQNLCRLTSRAYREGFYFKPRIDKELLQEFNSGLIATSSCIGGEVPSHILAGEMKQARTALAEYLDILGRENFYLELQDHGMEEQTKVNKELVKLSREFDIPLVATNDAHYLTADHAAAHDILLCIGTQKTVAERDRLRFPTDEFYFKSGEEMAKIFSEVPEAIRNTVEVAEKCNLILELNQTNHYPVFELPENINRKDYLIQQCKIGLRARYGLDLESRSVDSLTADEQKITSRMSYEIDVIDKMGFSSYFLVVWDFLSYARGRGIPIGPGRGSGAGSLVAYLLRITDIDPLHYNLLFERFLNPDRISPPDFDIDLCERRRYEVIEYVRNKYGEDSVAQIGTFGTLKAKAVIKDVTRVMGRPFDDGLRLTKLIPNDPKIKLQQAFDEVKELKFLRDTESWVGEVMKYSTKLEGLVRNMSIHAAGVIIGDQPLTNLVPLARGNGDEIITQYPAGPCEALGLLKLDFLGLRTLTIIQDTCDLIAKQGKDKIIPGQIALEDPATFELINKGNTISVFQLESAGMRDLCRRFGVHKIEDIIALIALYRPGPMQFLDEFIERKSGKQKVDYDLPTMEPILKETYGIMLYQEQVMQVVQTVAGFSLAQADILRRAMGKKKKEEMKAQFKKFEEGCKDKKISAAVAKKIFDKIELFAGYGFNKSHSAAYAIIAYQTAYLKANYPVEFMCANLSNEMHSSERVAFLISECREMGIDVLPPDANRSDLDFTVDVKSIRFGLAAIKGVGSSAAKAVLDSRVDGPFSSMIDFYERTGSSINRRIMESLSQCGAFDCFGLKRSQHFAMVDDVISRAQATIRDRVVGQENFFDLLNDAGAQDQEIPIPDIPEWDQQEVLKLEKSLLGFYVTGHPLGEYADVIKTYALHSITRLSEVADRKGVRIGGIISDIKIRYSKKDGSPWAIIQLEDFEGNAECLAYSEVYAQSLRAITENSPVFIDGTATYRDGESQPKVVVSRVLPIHEVPHTLTKEIHIRLYEANLTESTLADLTKLCRNHAGTTTVILTLICSCSQIAFVKTGKKFYVDFSMDLCKQIEDLLGEESVLIKPDKTLPEREKRRWEKQTTASYSNAQ